MSPKENNPKTLLEDRMKKVLKDSPEVLEKLRKTKHEPQKENKKGVEKGNTQIPENQNEEPSRYQNLKRKAKKFGDTLVNMTEARARAQGYNREYLKGLSGHQLRELYRELLQEKDSANIHIVRELLFETQKKERIQKKISPTKRMLSPDQNQTLRWDGKNTRRKERGRDIPYEEHVDNYQESLMKERSNAEPEESTQEKGTTSDGLQSHWEQDNNGNVIVHRGDPDAIAKMLGVEEEKVSTSNNASAEASSASTAQGKEDVHKTETHRNDQTEAPSKIASLEKDIAWMKKNTNRASEIIRAERKLKNLKAEQQQEAGIKSPEEKKHILAKRRFNHTAKMFGYQNKTIGAGMIGRLFAEEGKLKSAHKKQIRELQSLFERGFDNLSEKEQKKALNFDPKKFINEKQLSKEEQQALTLEREKVEILDRRIRKQEYLAYQETNKNAGSIEQLKNRFGLAMQQFSRWYEKPANKKKLHRRALVSTVTTAGLALTGVGGLGFIGGNILRFGMSYAGGETARYIFDRSKKDYRQRMADLRKKYTTRELRGGHVYHEKPDGSGELIQDKAYLDYAKARNELLDDSARYIKKKNKQRKWIDTAGRVAGGIVGRGIDEAFEHLPIGAQGSHEAASSLTSESLSENSPQPQGEMMPDPSLATETAPSAESLPISSDAMIRKGEGITYALKRQLDASPELQKAFGLKGKPSAQDLSDIGKKLGYINKDGSQDIRVNWGDGAAYELKLDPETGKPFVQEYHGGKIVDGHYEGGSPSEVRDTSSSFEGRTHEDYEYLENDTRGTTVAGNENISARELYPDIMDHIQTSHETPTMDALIENAENHTPSRIGNFEVDYDQSGNPELSVHDDYEFGGDTRSDVFDTVEKNGLYDKQYELVKKIDNFSDSSPMNIVKMANGQYALEVNGGSLDVDTSQMISQQDARMMMKRFGMKNTDNIFTVDTPLVKKINDFDSMKISRSYVPLSKDQAAHIIDSHSKLETLMEPETSHYEFEREVDPKSSPDDVLEVFNAMNK